MKTDKWTCDLIQITTTSLCITFTLDNKLLFPYFMKLRNLSLPNLMDYGPFFKRLPFQTIILYTFCTPIILYTCVHSAPRCCRHNGPKQKRSTRHVLFVVLSWERLPKWEHPPLPMCVCANVPTEDASAAEVEVEAGSLRDSCQKRSICTAFSALHSRLCVFMVRWPRAS
jgi:hypothetical protein